MNCVKLVESGEYKKEELSKENQAYISGMERCHRILEKLFDESDFNGMEFSSTIAKIQKEIADSVVECVRDRIYIEKCEMIVGLLDEEAEAE